MGEISWRKKSKEGNLDKIRGGLLGGAVGDALGYPVEFLSGEEIKSRYGEKGIRDYQLDPGTGMALISDDTQMSLFTANGILYGDTKRNMSGISAAVNPSVNVALAYQDWYFTQAGTVGRAGDDRVSWLLDIPQLRSRRAPGNTCMAALASGRTGSVRMPINQSKGCGGVMRVAPLGLHYQMRNRDWLDLEGAEVAAVTHGHSLGYMPAAVLTHIVNVAVYGGCGRGSSLRDAVEEGMETAARLFRDDRYLPQFQELIGRAVSLSENDREDEENISRLGEGRTGDEVLAIAVYCSLRYSGDFSRGIIAAVNHGGDSDSTGAVTGNILGSWLGFQAIEEKWKEKLELKDIILEMADDLCYGCLISPYSDYRDPDWERKYVEFQH